MGLTLSVLEELLLPHLYYWGKGRRRHGIALSTGLPVGLVDECLRALQEKGLADNQSGWWRLTKAGDERTWLQEA